MSISHSLTIDDIRSGRAFQWSYLRSQGLPWSRRCLRFLAGKYLAAILNFGTTTRPTWNGNNSSGWRDDILAVNGFDERMKYGGLDRELGERLENAGVHGVHIRYSTVVLHLDHPRGYVKRCRLGTQQCDPPTCSRRRSNLDRLRHPKNHRPRHRDSTPRAPSPCPNRTLSHAVISLRRLPTRTKVLLAPRALQLRQSSPAHESMPLSHGSANPNPQSAYPTAAEIRC